MWSVNTTERTTMTSLTPGFLNQVAQLRTFVDTHGRLPVQCDATDPHERTLGDFLRSQRGSHTWRTVSEATRERAAHLDQEVPTWRTDARRPVTRRSKGTDFEKRVEQVARFVTRHGNIPRCTAPAGTLERELGTFLMNCRQAARGKGTMVWNVARASTLEAKVPGWNAVNPEAKFASNLSSLRDYVSRTGTRPRRGKGPLDDAGRLALFVQNTLAAGNEARRKAIADTLALAA